MSFKLSFLLILLIPQIIVGTEIELKHTHDDLLDCKQEQINELKLVNLGLDWLARNQNNDGSWSTKVEVETLDHKVFTSGLATLAFFGAGHSERSGKYKNNLKTSIKYFNNLVEHNFFDETNDSLTTSIALCVLSEATIYGSSPKTISSTNLLLNKVLNDIDHLNIHDDELNLRTLTWYTKALNSARASMNPLLKTARSENAKMILKSTFTKYTDQSTGLSSHLLNGKFSQLAPICPCTHK